MRLTSPAGREVALVARGGALRLPPLEEVGVWRLAGAGRQVRFAASLLDAEESDLTSRAPALGAPGAGGTAAAAAQRTALRGLGQPLITAALLLLLEAAAFHRRWSL